MRYLVVWAVCEVFTSATSHLPDEQSARLGDDDGDDDVNESALVFQ